MFLLVSGRHVGAHLGGYQHGGSTQISINLGKTFLLISSARKIAVTWILARVFAYLPSFYFQILDLMAWTVFIFYFDLFWMAWHWKPAIVIINTLNLGRELNHGPIASVISFHRHCVSHVFSDYCPGPRSVTVSSWHMNSYFMPTYSSIIGNNPCLENVFGAL